MLLAAVLAMAASAPGAALADQSSQPSSPAAGEIATGNTHSCAIVAAAVRCWGYGADGPLGYGNRTTIGDDETPASAGPVDLGPGSTVRAVSAGNAHTCALLTSGAVHCWGFGADGRLGYGNTNSIGDDEAPVSAGPVFLGPGRTAKAITAANGSSCAILNNGEVRCWGFNLDGRLGLLHTQSIGDAPNRLPGVDGPVLLADGKIGVAGPVDFGVGRTAKAISGGAFHTCAILDDDSVRCWGYGGNGRLGYGDTRNIGRERADPGDPNELPTPRLPVDTPATIGPVDLGSHDGVPYTAKAISAGYGHTCAIRDDDRLLCWGYNGRGRLGYGNQVAVGDSESPGSVGPVSLGVGRTAAAVDAGDQHTCVVLDDGAVRCWGDNAFGQLGYPGTPVTGRAVGDNELPSAVAPVDLGGVRAIAISAAQEHTCARLQDGSVRCWGYGSAGRLGLCNEKTIGDDEPASSVGTVAIGMPGIPGTACPPRPVVVAPPAAAPPPPAATVVPDTPAPPPAQEDELATALAAQRDRATALRDCRSDVARRLAADRRKALGLASSKRRLARLQAQQRAARGRTACLTRHGRTPGSVTGLAAKASAAGKLVLSFRVAGTDGSKPPAARRYLVKQSERPIRTAADFRRAAALCRGTCTFDVTRLDATAQLTITDLRRNRRYYYAVVARDNVSGRTGPRSKTVTTKAR
jgi:alpha-tubulin suppressor-like RCC1 family protein